MGEGEKVILVTGATGRQGGAVARCLLARGWRVRGLTRDPSSSAARALGAQGIELVAGNLDDAASLDRACGNVYGVFSVQNFWEVGASREVVQGKNLADSAKKASVQHFVYSSVGGAERNSGIDHWESKWAVEQHIRKLKLPATILRPAAFMENYYIDKVEIALLKGKLLDAIRPDKSYQTIATDDIGAFAALAFARPGDFIGRELELAGSELTNLQAAEVFSRVLGKPIRFQRLPLLLTRLALGREFYQMFRWFNAGGFQADIPALRRLYPEVPLMDLETWLRREGWHKRARRVVSPPRRLDK